MVHEFTTGGGRGSRSRGGAPFRAGPRGGGGGRFTPAALRDAPERATALAANSEQAGRTPHDVRQAQTYSGRLGSGLENCSPFGEKDFVRRPNILYGKTCPVEHARHSGWSSQEAPGPAGPSTDADSSRNLCKEE